MRPYVLLALGVLLVGSGASAAEFSTVDHASYAVEPGQRWPIQIYQNYDITTIGDTQVACGVAGEYTTENWFLRRFYLDADHGLPDGMAVENVSFGVSLLTGNITVDVVVYQIPHGSSFVFANMTELGRESVELTPDDQGSLVDVDLQNSQSILDGVDQDLVVAIHAPNGEPNLVRFYPGANDAGATHDAYIVAGVCGITEPVPVGDIGFPESQTVLIVSGDQPLGDISVTCCFPDGHCSVLAWWDCADWGGDIVNADSCDPNPCPPPASSVPDEPQGVSRVSWGEVRGVYR